MFSFLRRLIDSLHKTSVYHQELLITVAHQLGQNSPITINAKPHLYFFLHITYICKGENYIYVPVVYVCVGV